MLVSVTALALGLVVSLPLAIIARDRPLFRGVAARLASVVQTVPGLALLALFYPLLLALSALTQRLFGVGFSALGFLPSVLALTLYSMLPVLRNTVTGLHGVDPAMSRRRRRRHDAAAIAVDGRIAAGAAGDHGRHPHVGGWVIGTATLSTPIGQTSLGNYIFSGLQTQNWVFVLFGCFAAALLALAVDQLLALIENGVRQRSRRAPRSAASASPR